MSDDLVSRLRRAVTWQGVVPHGNQLARQAADEIERLRDELRRVSIHREGGMKLCLICFASADLGDAIEHTSECLLNEGGVQ